MNTINIRMDNGDKIKWIEGTWNDYMYDDKFFIIRKEGIRVGLYNLDFIVSIVIE